MSRPSELRRIVLGMLAGASGLAACSLTRPSVDECSTTADCREVFGAGMSCGSDGLCEKTAQNPRCDQAFPDDLLIRPENYPDVIIFGNLMDRSISTQVEREHAVRLAATQVRAEGGFDNKTFGVVFCDIAQNPKYDSLTRTEAARAAADYLVAAYGVPAIIGPSSSPDTLAVFEEVENDGVLVISPSATSTELTGVDVPVASDDNPGLLWRTAPPDSIQGLAIAKHFKQLPTPPTHVVVIHEAGAYGEALSTVFKDTYATAGETVELLSYANANERDAHVQATAQSPADTVLFVSSQTTDAADFLVLAATLSTQYLQKNLFLTDSAANADFLQKAASASVLFPRVNGSRPGLGGAYGLFHASFNAAFKVDANAYSYVAHAYDAAWVVFYGSVWSLTQEGGLTGRGIARGIRRVRGGPTTFQVEPLDWSAIKDELAAGRIVDIEGASGPLDFDAVTEEPSSAIEIWKISTDGQLIELVTTID